MLLPNDDIQAIIEAMTHSGIPYDGLNRIAFCAGIRADYFGMKPLNPTPLMQLRLDLNAFNSDERLADGSVPLEIWLNNAAGILSGTLQAKVMHDKLAAVSQSSLARTPIVQPNNSIPIIQERIILQDDTLPVLFMARGSQIAQSVTRVKVQRFDNGVPAHLPSGTPMVYTGTAWIIGPNLLITNHHVVNARDDGDPDATADDFRIQAANIIAQFDFDLPNAVGIEIPVLEVLASDKNLDFAILRYDASAVGNRPILPLLRTPIVVNDPKQIFAVNIVQHPGGGPKRVAIRNNLVYTVLGDVMRYFTDTKGGSSGSPGLNDAWQVVCLHRAAVPVTGVTFQGQSTGWVNEGTLICSILNFLQANAPAVAAMI